MPGLVVSLVVSDTPITELSLLHHAREKPLPVIFRRDLPSPEPSVPLRMLLGRKIGRREESVGEDKREKLNRL